MARSGIRNIGFGLAAAGLLMGCVEGGGKAGGTAGGAAGGFMASPAKSGAPREVEAPDVFQTTDSALWDGRPSLGGIWVASPDVKNPERVVMFNPATGKSISGALFKRERDNPGPRLQLSSDAADALGILAGQPTEIKVTAVRKEEVAAAPADPAAAALPGAEAEAPPPKDAAQDPNKVGAKTEAGNGDAAAIASAALAAVDAGKTAPAAGEAAKDPNATGAAVAAAADGVAAMTDETPKRKTWKERRAEAKAAREAKKRAAAEAKAAAAAGEAGTVMAPGEAQGEAPTASPDSAAPAAISSAPLDARKPEVAAGTAEKPKRSTVAGTAPKAAAPTVAADPAPPVAGGPVRPIQVASFSKEDNANRAAQALAKIGITATPQKSEKGGKAVWGVIVQGDEAMLKKIKDAGFADAYFLK